MNIEKVTSEDLRRMENQEGLILQGCGGDLNEWVDGINQLLTANDCLRDGTQFQKVSTFEQDGLTCLLFHFTDDVKVNGARLAMWRLASHDQFGGTWLSDFVPNRLGGFARDQPEKVEQKPDCPLIGADGNIFNLLGIASRALKENGSYNQAKEMRSRVYQSQSYDSALSIIGDYVNVTSVNEEQTGEFDMRME